MTIAARFENGVFRPLERVRLEEGARVEVYVPSEAQQPKSLRELRAFGTWADREDIPDEVTYVNRMRAPRY